MTSEPVTSRRSAARLPLGARGRKIALVTHIVSAGAWIGIDVVLAVLVVTAFTTNDAHTATIAYQALALFAIYPLFIVGLTTLASGMLLGLGTKYGLVRYWWVLAKLVINIVFVALVPLSLSHSVSEAAELGRQAVAAHPGIVTDLIPPPIVSPAGLLIAVILAVFKPWGRIRRTAGAGGR